MYPYDSAEVTLSFAGYPIESGRAKGEFVSSEYTSEITAEAAGADGVVAVSKMNDQSATITIKVLQGSPGHAQLTEMAARSRATRGIATGVYELRDLSGGLVESAQKAWIKKEPSNAYGAEAGEREWKLGCEKLVRGVL